MKVRIALAALAGVATLATLGVAAAATSASASTIPTTVSQVTYAPRSCAGWQLSATLTVGYQRGLSRELVLTLTNNSSSACTLSGYPGLQLLNNSYRPLPTTTVQLPGVPIPEQAYLPAGTVLRPGRAAIADITFAVLGHRFYPLPNYTGYPVFPASAAYLAVTLPNVYPGHGQQYGQRYGQRFVLPIPGGPVQIVQDRLYETPLTLEYPGVW